MKRRQLSCYDICCGAGAFSFGFKSAGFKALGGIDNNNHAIATAQYNIPEGKWEHLPIESLATNGYKNSVYNASVIIAGLPCQGFSTAGKCNPDDERNHLYKDLLKIINKVKPRFVVIENVQGLLAKRNKNIFLRITNGLKNIGYDVGYRLYEAANLGAPQYRKRILIVASSKIPARYVFEGIQFAEEHKTVREALRGVPPKREIVSKNHTFMVHSKKVINKISKITNGDIISYKRLKNDLPSYTIISGHNALPVHPTEHRAISNREAARLQGIPDSFIFQGPRTEQTVQVANAVPFQMAKRIAVAIKKSEWVMKNNQGNLYNKLVAKYSKPSKELLRKYLIRYYNNHGLNYPWRKIKDPYKILLTEILLQRTKGSMVKQIWRDVMTSVKPINHNFKINIKVLNKAIRKIGIFNRVQTIENLNYKMVQYFRKKVPKNFDELMNLPGVGIYIAAAVRTFAFNIPDFPVDSNAFRFISRFYGIKIAGKKSEARQIREFMNIIISAKKPKEFVYGFLDFCSVICSPLSPKCNKCRLCNKCVYNKNL